MSPNRTFTCSFCCNQFSAQEVLFRCISRHCWGEQEDERYSRVSGRWSVKMGRVLVPGAHSTLDAAGLPQAVTCDMCRVPSKSRICPYCHFELPANFGQIKQCSIAIIGGPAVGKTHFLAALLKRLYEVAPQLRMSVQLLSEAMVERWERDYAPLFTEKVVIPSTQSVNDISSIRYPLVMRLIMSLGQVKQICDIGLFDPSGVDMQLAGASEDMKWYVRHANGVIFLLDPLQIPGALPESAAHRRKFTGNPLVLPENAVTYLRNLFEAEHLVKPNEALHIPVALTLSKLDLLLPYVDAGSLLRRYYIPEKIVDMENLQSVSTDVTALLSDWIGPTFCQTIRREIPLHAYFGISALGTCSNIDGRLSGISPFRVEDPFLWLLYQLDIVKI